MCYMNATIQCLRVVPELLRALDDYETPDRERIKSSQRQDLHPAALTTGNVWLIFRCRTPQGMYDMSRHTGFGSRNAISND